MLLCIQAVLILSRANCRAESQREVQHVVDHNDFHLHRWIIICKGRIDDHERTMGTIERSMFNSPTSTLTSTFTLYLLTCASTFQDTRFQVFARDPEIAVLFAIHIRIISYRSPIIRDDVKSGGIISPVTRCAFRKLKFTFPFAFYFGIMVITRADCIYLDTRLNDASAFKPNAENSARFPRILRSDSFG